MLKVSRSELHGHGCFITGDSSAGEIVGTSRFLAFPPEETARLFRTKVKNYLFYLREGDAEGGPFHSALAMGPISFCNHSPDPNCDFVVDETAGEIRLTARRDLKAGEEITIDYGEYAQEIV